MRHKKPAMGKNCESKVCSTMHLPVTFPNAENTQGR